MLLATLSSLAVDAEAQTAPGARSSPGERGFTLPSISFSSDTPPPDATRTGLTLSSRRPGRLTWSGEISGESSGIDIWSLAGNQQAWRVRTGVGYSTRDVTLALDLQGHHGYQLPSSMSSTLGAASTQGLPQPGFVDATGSRVWEARVMLRGRLFGSDRGAAVDAVTEAILPLGRGLERANVPGSLMPIRSRAFRFGIVISY